MTDSSSEGSEDEEDILSNFDKEAKLIIQNDSLPKKSSERYVLVYNTYKRWQEENQSCLSSSDENNLVVYFNSLKAKLQPPTLWSIWSMLKKTLSARENININNFLNLKNLLKNYSKGYQPKKAFTLKWNEINKFITEAPDCSFLASKVILIFGICGALRCDEITNMKITDVEDLGDKFLVSIQYNKNQYPGRFIIGELFYQKVKSYASLRPDGDFSERFFLQYSNGKCIRQPIGRHKISEVPGNIAAFLNLDNPKRYTGHCFRRTSATLLSESGATMQAIKQAGRWRSDIIAQGYIENSIHNRNLIYEGITHARNLPSASTSTNNLVNLPVQQITTNVPPVQETTTNVLSAQKTPINVQRTEESTLNIPSSSTNVDPILSSKPSHEKSNSAQGILDCNLSWDDFSEEFTSESFQSNNKNQIQGDIYFTTANKENILVPEPNKNSISTRVKKLFSSKPPVKLIYNNKNNNNNIPLPTAVQSHSNKKRKIDDESQDQNNNNSEGTTFDKGGVKFEACSFNNCTFNFQFCNCNKDDNK